MAPLVRNLSHSVKKGVNPDTKFCHSRTVNISIPFLQSIKYFNFLKCKTHNAIFNPRSNNFPGVAPWCNSSYSTEIAIQTKVIKQ